MELNGVKFFGTEVSALVLFCFVGIYRKIDFYFIGFVKDGIYPARDISLKLIKTINFQDSVTRI